MSFTRSASIMVAACALCIAGCKSESKHPYPQGFPQQGYPMQQPMQQPQQPMQQPQQPMQQQPQQPQQPAQQNPLAALGQAMGQLGGQPPPPGQPQQATPGASVGGLVPWAELAKAIPMSAPGWTAQGEATGETAALMGFGASTARGRLLQGGMQAEIEIVDNAMAAGMAGMGFAMVPTVDSSDQRMGRVSIGPYPGMQTFHKNKNTADVVVIVANRLMVTVKVSNTTSEQAALQLANLVNYQHLTTLIGG